jgi:hypothetical protein
MEGKTDRTPKYYIPSQGSSCPWSYGNWIYNYLCNQCLSPLMLWVQITFRARCTTLYDKVCQLLATGRWFTQGPPVSSYNKTDRYDITEILLKVALNTIKPTKTYTLLSYHGYSEENIVTKCYRSMRKNEIWSFTQRTYYCVDRW